MSDQILKPATDTLPDAPMTLGDHLNELRKRLFLSGIGLIIAVVFCLFFTGDILAFLVKPYNDAMTQAGLKPSLQILAPTDGFTTYLKIATWTGLVLASPWIFYQLWKFVAAGLYLKERRYVYIAAPACAILFVTGTLFCVLFIAPMALQFLINFNKDFLAGAVSSFTFKEYLTFMVSMLVAFGLAFQTPVIMFFLNRFGLLGVPLINKSRRYVIFFIVVAAAVITPGSDLISLLSLAAALYFLFELGFIVILFAGRK